jgi:hypothetical protein
VLQLHRLWFCCCGWQVGLLIPHFYQFCLLVDISSIQHLQRRADLFWTLKTTQKAAVFLLCALRKLCLVISKVLVAFFSSLSKISCTLFFQFCHFSRYTTFTGGAIHSCTYQDITQQSHILQPYSKEEVTE